MPRSFGSACWRSSKDKDVSTGDPTRLLPFDCVRVGVGVYAVWSWEGKREQGPGEDFLASNLRPGKR